MPYPTIPGRKFEYDIAGGSAYLGVKVGDIVRPLTTEELTRFNGTSNSKVIHENSEVWTRPEVTFWIFLPEKYNVSGLGFLHLIEGVSGSTIEVHGSPDSTNGLDGLWIKATLPNGPIPLNLSDDDAWRSDIQICNFSEAVKVIRVNYKPGYASTYSWVKFWAIHVYGTKAEGEVPNDILFLDDDEDGDPEFVRDLDFGDRPEGTTATHRIKLFNSSTTKIANNLSLSLVDTDYLFSMDEGSTWVTSASITSLAPQGKSVSIIIKNTVPPPIQVLGPRAPRFEVIIGSWT